MTEISDLAAVALSGSPSRDSKSRRLLEHALKSLAARGARTQIVDLGELPADALLGRAPAPAVSEALAAVASARIVLAGTPVYRATYSGLLKVFFDLLPADGLAGRVAIPVATGGGEGHRLILDHGLRPLFASVGAVVVSTGIYATDAQFGPDGPDPSLLARLDRAVIEALSLAQFSR